MTVMTHIGLVFRPDERILLRHLNLPPVVVFVPFLFLQTLQALDIFRFLMAASGSLLLTVGSGVREVEWVGSIGGPLIS